MGCQREILLELNKMTDWAGTCLRRAAFSVVEPPASAWDYVMFLLGQRLFLGFFFPKEMAVVVVSKLGTTITDSPRFGWIEN